MSKKIIIMTVPFGGGHHSTADTVRSLLLQRQPDVSVEIIDVITEAWPAFSERSTRAYVNSTSSPGGWLFKVYYRASDKFPQPLKWFASAAFKRYARRRIKELNPDLIIATFPFLGHVAARARDYHRLQAPIITLVTDAGKVQGIWLSGHEDVILTATEETVSYAKRRDLGQAHIKHIGFPVAEKFYQAPTKTAARRQLSLDNDFTVLITAGGLGMKPARVLKLAQALTKTDQPMQLVFVAGKNHELLRRLKRIEFPANIKCQFLGFSDQMEQLMAAADLVATKAGWLTISEALTVGRPLLLFDSIPGQEEQNTQYVVGHGYGLFESNPTRAAEFIVRSAASDKTLHPYHAALRRRGSKREVPRLLADYCLSLLK